MVLPLFLAIMNNLFKYSDINSFIKTHEISKLTEVQTKSIPKFLAGLNLSVLAQTGSGKTFSYLFPLVELLKKEEKYDDQEWKEASPRAIIVTPTRELTEEEQKELDEREAKRQEALNKSEQAKADRLKKREAQKAEIERKRLERLAEREAVRNQLKENKESDKKSEEEEDDNNNNN